MLKPLTVWITTNGKILKEMGIPDHLTYLLRNLYADQEATVRTEHGTMDWFKIEKGLHQGCILSPCLINLYAEYIMWNSRLDESQAGIKIAVRNINNLRYADDQEATVRTGHGITDWFQIGKGVRRGCILSPCLFNLYAEYIMRNTGLEETQTGIKTAREISITSVMQITPLLWQKVKRN